MEFCLIRKKRNKKYMYTKHVNSGCDTCGGWTEIHFDKLPNILKDENSRLCIFERIDAAKDILEDDSEVVMLSEVKEVV